MRRVKPLKLHTKTTLLASAITLAVLVVTVALMTARVVESVQQEQRARVQLQAISLANQISQMPMPRDPQEIVRAATLVHSGRPNNLAVRVWERGGGTYALVASVGDNGAAPSDLPEETKAALRSGQESRVTISLPADVKESVFRAAEPIFESGRPSGAVEIIEKLDDTPSIAQRYEKRAIWIALGAVVLITCATYLLFRQFVYAPVERLLLAMARVEAGDLRTRVPLTAPDEIGMLSRGFNRMVARLRAMTKERESQRNVLQERVEDATMTLKQRNEQLLDTNRELWQTSRRLTELERLAAAGQTAAQFAHEVGTPLNLISGHVQLLRARIGDDQSAIARLETIGAQIERIERIVRRMLDRTRPEAVELAPLDINALLNRTFEAIAPALEARGVKLEAELQDALPLIAGDADRLQQTFINLINNALDAMPDGGMLHIRTEVKRNSTEKEASDFEEVFVEFADTGCGMSADVRAKIFDPHFTTKERGRGTGLGLVIVKQVIREHGGEIEVESEERRGTYFRLHFPVLVETSDEDSAAAREGESKVESATNIESSAAVVGD